MQFLLLVYENRANWAALGATEQQRIATDCNAWFEELKASGHGLHMARLEPAENAQTVRRDGGSYLVTDGPFAETKEILAGFELIDVENSEEALRYAKSFPVLQAGYAVEVRPVRETAE